MRLIWSLLKYSLLVLMATLAFKPCSDTRYVKSRPLCTADGTNQFSFMYSMRIIPFNASWNTLLVPFIWLLSNKSQCNSLSLENRTLPSTPSIWLQVSFSYYFSLLRKPIDRRSVYDSWEVAGRPVSNWIPGSHETKIRRPLHQQSKINWAATVQKHQKMRDTECFHTLLSSAIPNFFRLKVLHLY